MEILRYSHFIPDRSYVPANGERGVISISLPAPPWIKSASKPVHLRQRRAVVRRSVEIRGVTYKSLRSAAKALGIAHERLSYALERNQLEQLLTKIGK
jgi:hypothetical protein